MSKRDPTDVGEIRPEKVAVDAFPGGQHGYIEAGLVLRATQKARNDALEAENAELKKALGIEMTLDGWGEFSSQELRDQMAASALVASALHPFYALKRLGFKPKAGDHDQWYPLAEAVFKTPGVAALLNADREKFAQNKDAVLTQMFVLTQTGDDRAKVAAAAVMAKMIPGWSEGEKKSNVFAENFLVWVGQMGNGKARIVGNGEKLEAVDPDRIIDAEEFLALDTAEVATVEDAPEVHHR